MKLVDDRVLVPEQVGHRRQQALLGHHAVPARGWIRQTANGITAGSRRICCSFPFQVKLRSLIKSVTATEAASDSPQSHSGTSMSHSGGTSGSRLTAPTTTALRPPLPFEK